jgi:phosphorylcholine metabolism protein LicD
MSKKLVIFIFLGLIVSIALAFFSNSYKNNKVDALSVAKSNNENDHVAIKNLSKQQLDNSGLLNKIEKDPEGIAQRAKERVQKFVDEVKEGNTLKDNKQDAYYKQHFKKNYATEDIIQNEEVKQMTIPDKYDVYINTSRGHYMQFMVKDATKKEPKRYFTVNYNNSTNKVEGIKEFDVRS